MAKVQFAGTFTALVTPFTEAGDQVDHSALERLVEAQLAGGVGGLVPCGTTGETPTLSAAEQLEVIARVVEVAAGRVPVVAGAGSNNTQHTIALCQAAVGAGADALMVVMPYYNKPSQAGLVAHVTRVAAAVDAPIIVYNIPGRSVVDLSAEATEQLCAAAPNVVAIKDATGNVVRCQQLVRRLGDRLAVMSGDDGLTLPMMACGARGVISVSANVLPAQVSEVTRLLAAGRWRQARAQHLRLLPFHAAMFAEPNPAPCKAALALGGHMHAAVRLPMLTASEQTRAHLSQLLDQLSSPLV
ncbi:MAG TPA: 4-hydroxy-tetrahydrodipicolinate synthase [Sorangium sp.]|nr:4-hydroxy-tetrahydrodipicolinate synthase [Sorangium sp.]